MSVGRRVYDVYAYLRQDNFELNAGIHVCSNCSQSYLHVHSLGKVFISSWCLEILLSIWHAQ
jgi:hypothetical protein